mmetsp:Transcript_29036/g.93269  ORF Transcript_29036/g.93269 Transcript_29036/m.93269 type:complete len:241 (-) Transcript_29036:226-948(-)
MQLPEMKSTLARASWLVVTLVTLTFGIEVKLVTFDGTDATSHHFDEWEDPVMGSRSYGNWTVDAAGQFGRLRGVVTVAPRPATSIPHASPGYVDVGTDGPFPDASLAGLGDLVLMVRSTTPKFKGFRVAFASGAKFPTYACKAGGSLPLSSGCWKAMFMVPAGTEFAEVRVPLNTFSDKWDPQTGMARKTCEMDASVCPSVEALKRIQRIELWAEGYSGDIDLQFQSISVASSVGSSFVV